MKDKQHKATPETRQQAPPATVADFLCARRMMTPGDFVDLTPDQSTRAPDDPNLYYLLTDIPKEVPSMTMSM